jgi:prolipoprotein diacylglyceryltransferase
MLPYITIGDVKLPIFSFGLSVSAIIFLLLCVKSTKERGLGEEVGGETAVLILFVIVFFSKVPLGMIYGWKIQSFFKFWETGHTLFGGLILGVLAALIYSLIKKMSFIELLSALSYPSFFALASYRVFVCLLTGCCYGFPSEKYGIIFHPESYAGRTLGWTPKLFPSQIIEAVLFLICGFVIYAIRKKEKPERIIQIYLLLMTIQRIIAELIRRDIKETFFKVGDFGISFWAILSISLFVATSLFFNVLKPYFEELKKITNYFLILFFLVILAAANSISCSQNDKKNKNHSDTDIIEALKISYTFTFSTIFVSYIFFQIQQLIKYCVFKDDQTGKIKINCSLDLRAISVSRGPTKGECDFQSDKGKAIFKNCEIEIKGEGGNQTFWAKIYGNIETVGFNAFFESITFEVFSSISNFRIEINNTQSKIFQIEGGAIRYFEIKGEGKIDKDKIHADRIIAKDEGEEKVGIMPQGNFEISGCKNLKLNIFSKEYIYFDRSGCPISGQVKVGEEEIIFSSPPNCSSEQRGCQFIIF